MLEEIIESCKYVSENSKSVQINEINLDNFIKKLII